MERYNQTLKGKLTERIEIQGQKEEVQPALVSVRERFLEYRHFDLINYLMMKRKAIFH